ncbi:alanyl-tRNA editing protein [Niameybacter massiliensis]|uniref:Alanyl-tRNA editing protein n=1 Tax=Holtiella tumoricola TaxID=3018743 RepID=A0AA42DPY1_9FIRM|nr:alanyl-tRNA editing protein [Holtiella tumoricola]MDA3733094.1 alanyl-tRNA editing protein [Holtiella tumoricola]
MTHLIYYKKPYEMAFKAKVIKCIESEAGYCVLLDQTAFFPGGGGQPADQGILNGLPVVKLLEEEEHIYHIVGEPLEVGQEVEGIVDAKRRRDFMQQHSGEHIVSGLIHKLYGYNNVGFSLGEEKMTADFDGVLTKEQVEEVERLANEAVYQNIPIQGKGYTQQEIETIPYRSKKRLEGIIRLVDIEGYDCCACCGVHVETTGEIGVIKIITADKHRSGTRLTLLCGGRALKDYQLKNNQVYALMDKLSVKSEEVVEGVCRLVEEKEDLKQQVAKLKRQVFETKMAQVDLQEPLCTLEEATPFELRLFASIWMERSTAPCLLLTCDEKGYKYALGGPSELVGGWAKTLNSQFKGKGGGREICQGTLEGSYEAIKEAYLKVIS